MVEDGLDTEALETKLRAGLSPKAVYTNPNFQNPTGTTLSSDRRAHLTRLADQHDQYAQYDGHRLPYHKGYRNSLRG